MAHLFNSDLIIHARLLYRPKSISFCDKQLKVGEGADRRGAALRTIYSLVKMIVTICSKYISRST